MKAKMNRVRGIKTVGIALAAYNPELEFFEKQLASIQSQSFTNWFCILSFDSELEPILGLESFSKFRDDHRFVWLRNKSQPSAKNNFENAIKKCVEIGCDAIACSDQDDIWFRDKLESSVRLLDACPPLSLVHSDMIALREQRRFPWLISEAARPDCQTVWQEERRGTQNVSVFHLCIRNVVAGAAMLFDSELARLYPNIPIQIAYHDHWYALVAAASGGVYSLDKPLYAYRLHSKNLEGVTPFKSVFATSEKIHAQGIVNKLRRTYKVSSGNLQAVQSVSIRVGMLTQLTIAKKADLSVGYFISFLIFLKNDPALARACLARGLGKLLSIASPKTGNLGA